MGHALRYRDESELPESVRRRLQKRFVEKPVAPTIPPPHKVRRPRRDLEHNEQVVFFTDRYMEQSRASTVRELLGR